MSAALALAAALSAQGASAATADCEAISGALAQRECQLARWEAQFSDFECDGDGPQLELNMCSYRRYLQADIEMNRVWEQLRVSWAPDNIGPANWQALLGSQRAWLTYRDANCAIWRDMYEGGSIVPLLENSCMARVTQARTAELERLVDLP